MEFLIPILAKIELICQQPAISQLGGVQGGKPVSSGVLERMAEQLTQCSGYESKQMNDIRYIVKFSHLTYCQISDISYNLAGNQIIDHSGVVGASPVGAAPTTSSFST